MLVIETPVFTRLVTALLTDEELRRLQFALVLRPEQGALIPGAGGLRKLRWRKGGAGKRGGVRVIYYWLTADETIYMLFIYDKRQQADLSPQQLRALQRLVREELG